MTLIELANDVADDIRDGIAWIIVWKKKRSWCYYTFWVDSEDNFEDPEYDAEMINSALETDENAILINGYDNPRFCPESDILHIRDTIRFLYESECGLRLKGSAYVKQ